MRSVLILFKLLDFFFFFLHIKHRSEYGVDATTRCDRVYFRERLDVKTLIKFKSVSKQLKTTITQCRSFQERQLFRRNRIVVIQTFKVGSSVSIKNPTTWENKLYEVCNINCDGLICLYDSYGQSNHSLASNFPTMQL